MKQKIIILIIVTLFSLNESVAQYPVIRGAEVRVMFDQKILDWDGFGFNYVETAQTPDYGKFKQEYGGFSLLDEEKKSEIIEHVFGEDGLKVGLVKMFLDPFHQKEPGGTYDHETTTKYMREFVSRGVKKTRERGANLSIITTLYGPPAYMTLQKKIRGRDIDPAHKGDLADYLISWVKFLRENEKFPVNYISMHNEGEDWERWPWDGQDPNIGSSGHDYNMYWKPELVTEMMILTHKKLKKAGLKNIYVTPGENTNWYRFSYWGYADAIVEDKVALNSLGLITSHGFFGGSYNRWFGDHNSLGTELIRSKKPDLHAWVTSTSWSKMDAKNIKEMHDNIYSARVNGIIPWAGIQRPVQWVGGDPNPGSAFTVNEDGSYVIRRGYYFYKQISRPGQPGTSICRTLSNDTEVPVIAFGKGKSNAADAFVVTNINSQKNKPMIIKITGTTAIQFKGYRTTEDETEKYNEIGLFKSVNGELFYEAPAGSVTTFFAE